VLQIPETELYVHLVHSHQNTVRVVHLPTGLSEVYGEHQSLRRNKNEAVRRLTEKLQTR
jgi:protein subunit release factor A